MNIEKIKQQDVIAEELKHVSQRRRSAGFTPDARNEAEQLDGTLVGLALSGGGVRSASFNLGVLQAFYRSGLLRFVDYLSTVSGGGYIGSFFSSRVQASDEALYGRQTPAFSGAARAETTPATTPAANAQAANAQTANGQAATAQTATAQTATSQTTTTAAHSQNGLPPIGSIGPTRAGREIGMLPEADGRPAPAIRQLIRGGAYLNRPLLFFSRYLFGLVLNNIAILSLLIGFSATVAYLWRSLDGIHARWAVSDAFAWLTSASVVPISVRDWITGVLGDDAGIPFLPAFGFFLIWFNLFWLATAIKNVCPRLSALLRPMIKYLLLVAGACFLIGLAVVLSNGDIAAGPLGAVTGHHGRLWPFGLLVLVCLLPVLRPWRLLGSGQSPRSTLEMYVFRLSSTALLVGVPLFIIYLFARENISGYGTYGADKIEHWKKFFERVREDKDKGRWPGAQIHNQLGPKQVEVAVMDRGPLEFRQPKGNGAALAEYDVSGMADVKELNQQRQSPDTIKTLQDFFAERDVSPAVGILEKTDYPHINKRRQMVLRAVNRAIDDQWFALGFLAQDPHLEVARRLQEEASRITGFIAASPLAASALDTLASKPQPRTGAGADAAAVLRAWQEQEKAKLEKEENGRLQAPGISGDERATTRRDFEAKRKELQTLSDLLQKYDYLSRNFGRAEEFRLEFQKSDFKRELGRRLLAYYYQPFIGRDAPQIKRVVVIDEDQHVRLVWMALMAGVFVFALLVVNFNTTSLHGFYRDQLSDAFLAGGPTLTLARLQGNTAKGAPYHLIVATLIQYGSPWKAMLRTCKGMFVKHADKGATKEAGNEDNPPPTDPFLFTPHYCGSDSTGFRSTDGFAVNECTVNLADAMAISGAAVTPFQVRNQLVRVLMMILNIRLGQWLPNPGNPRAPARRPSIARVLFSNIFLDPDERALCFVTDGGHHENLGILPLLKRRCFFIVAADASQDNHHIFEDFVRLCRRARLEEGISLVELAPQDGQDVPFQLHPLRLHPDGPGSESRHLRSLAARFSNKHYVIARIKYPPPADGQPQPANDHGYLVYLKASLTGDEDNDLVAFCQAHDEFPHDPTSNAIFDEDQVESYRQLGFHIADGLCRDLEKTQPAPAGADQPADQRHGRLWRFQHFDIVRIVEQWIGAAKKQESQQHQPGLRESLAEFLRSQSNGNGKAQSDDIVIPAEDVANVRAELTECLNSLNGRIKHVEMIQEAQRYLQGAFEILSRPHAPGQDLRLPKRLYRILHIDHLHGCLRVLERLAREPRPWPRLAEEMQNRIGKALQILDASVQDTAYTP